MDLQNILFNHTHTHTHTMGLQNILFNHKPDIIPIVSCSQSPPVISHRKEKGPLQSRLKLIYKINQIQNLSFDKMLIFLKYSVPCNYTMILHCLFIGMLYMYVMPDCRIYCNYPTYMNNKNIMKRLRKCHNQRPEPTTSTKWKSGQMRTSTVKHTV